MISFEDKVAVITGAASGIGRALASRCLQEGMEVVMADVDEESLNKAARELEHAHLAIMPSHAESFGLSIAEAQAAGIPVVAYESGSVPEVVEDGVTAWLAPFRQVNQLAQLIESAICHPEQTYQAGLAGRERIKRLFTWEKTAASMFEKIQTVCFNGNNQRRAS